MKIMETKAARSLMRLYDQGAQKNWMGVAGDSVSRWLTTPELMEIQEELDFNSQDYIDLLTLKEPRLARECIMYCCHGDEFRDEFVGIGPVYVMVLQVTAEGNSCRVLWESGSRNRSPLEISLHLICHAAHSVGPGNVVYHCQPLNTLALVGLLDEHESDFRAELVKGFSAIISMVPGGIGIIPWRMDVPLEHGQEMTPAMYDTMASFLDEIRSNIAHQEALVLRGEGLICASRSEGFVFSIINAIERAATIRMKTLAVKGGI